MRASVLTVAVFALWMQTSGEVRGDDSDSKVQPKAPLVRPVEVETADPVDPAIEGNVSDLVRNSISCGAANRGALREAAEMPRKGAGFEIPEPWWSRSYRYGTDELVGMITRAAAAVEAEHPGGVLGVADLSRRRGGAIPGHRSHQAGRDVDLIFYSLDPEGNPFPPDRHMPYYTYSGRAHYAKAPHWARGIPERFFDLKRNWALIKAMMNDPRAELKHVFISRRIRRWILDYAKKVGEPEALIERAGRIMKKPANGSKHNDHMHIRISCSNDDVALGRCRNRIAKRRRGHGKFYSRIPCPAAVPQIVLPADSKRGR